MICALLPVKSLSRAKQRLSPVLSPRERRRLARAMYSEMLEKLLRVGELNSVVVASSDRWVLDHARRAGAHPLKETVQNGHSRSADWAAARCAEMGAGAVLLLPIDVPLSTTDELRLLVEAAKRVGRPGLVIVPSEDGSGTNALVRTPPDLITSCFGPGSFDAHLGQARNKDLPVEVVRPPGIVFDLDTPQDLVAFCRRARGGKTLDCLREINALAKAESHLRQQPVTT